MKNKKIIIDISNGPNSKTFNKKEELKEMGCEWGSLNGFQKWLITVNSTEKAKEVFIKIINMGLDCSHELENGEYLDELEDYYDELI